MQAPRVISFQTSFHFYAVFFQCLIQENNYVYITVVQCSHSIKLCTTWSRILVQGTIDRRLRIGRDGHLDQSEAYDLS